MRLVVDTDAIRSPSGASAALIVCLLERLATMLLQGFEYEATCLTAEHVLKAKASEADILNDRCNIRGYRIGIRGYRTG
jgi:hypothetical protein